MGSTRNLQPVHTADEGVVHIQGSFAPAGTDAVTDVLGEGFTAARTGVGAYLITLDRRYAKLISARADIQMSSATDLIGQFGDYTAASKTLVLRAQAAATPTEIAADANNRVHFHLVLSNRGSLS